MEFRRGLRGFRSVGGMFVIDWCLGYRRVGIVEIAWQFHDYIVLAKQFLWGDGRRVLVVGLRVA